MLIWYHLDVEHSLKSQSNADILYTWVLYRYLTYFLKVHFVYSISSSTSFSSPPQPVSQGVKYRPTVSHRQRVHNYFLPTLIYSSLRGWKFHYTDFLYSRQFCRWTTIHSLAPSHLKVQRYFLILKCFHWSINARCLYLWKECIPHLNLWGSWSPFMFISLMDLYMCWPKSV